MKAYSKLAVALLATAGVGAATTAIAAEQMGVSKNEIVIGTIQDLSGPLAGFGKALRYGMQMRVDEVNDQGGINGRKLKFVAEDSGYDPKKGLLAAQKMVQQDKLFAMVGTIGTAVNLATFPTLFDKGVMNLFPLTAAREMYEPLHKLKFSFAAPYYNQMRKGMSWMVKERGATDFSAQVSKMKAADCDTVVLGTIIRETIGTIGTARKMGWNPNFVGSSAAYTDLIHKLGGKAMDGLYAFHQVAVPYADDSSKNVRDWFASYKAKFNEDPGLFSAYGYVAMDMFVQTAKKTGANLTTDNFIKTLESTTFARDMFGSPEYKFTPKQHLGNDKSKVGQIQNGRWVAVTDYLSQ